MRSDTPRHAAQSGPGPLVRDTDPDRALFAPFPEAAVPTGPVQNADRCVVGVQDRRGHDLGLDLFGDRLEHLHGPTATIRQRAVRHVRAHPAVFLVEAKERHMVVELRDQNMSQQTRLVHASRDRAARGGRLNHLLATAERRLHPRDLDHLHLCRDHVERSHILADHAKVATEIRVQKP